MHLGKHAKLTTSIRRAWLGEIFALAGRAELGAGGAFAFDGTPLTVGDRVIPAPNRACGRCHMCARGFPYYLCRNLENCGNSLTSARAPHLFGGWADYLYLRPGTALFQVPAELPDEVAVLTEIFAVTHSLDRAAALSRPAGFRPGDTVAIIGAGPLGLAHAVKASLMGAGQLLVLDPSAPSRARRSHRQRGCARAERRRGARGARTLPRRRSRHRQVAFSDIVSHRFAIEDAPRAMSTALDPDASAKVLIVPRSRRRPRG